MPNQTFSLLLHNTHQFKHRQTRKFSEFKSCVFFATLSQLTGLLLIHIDMRVSFMSLISFNLFNELFESKDGQKTIVYKLVWWVHIVFSFWFYKGSKVMSFFIRCVHNVFLLLQQNIIHIAPWNKYQKILSHMFEDFFNLAIKGSLSIIIHHCCNLQIFIFFTCVKVHLCFFNLVKVERH